MNPTPFKAPARARLRLLGAALLALCLFPPLARASRIKDITLIEGDRDNQLVGYGLVVGLAGAGDSNPNATLHSVANVLQRYGITVNPQQDVTAKNTAAVMVTADISAFLKSGARIDVTVASLGDAKTLQGGVLLQTPLLGGDGHTASIFPHTEAIHEMSRLVAANYVPQKDAWRITLTWPVINHARSVFFLVSGEDKAAILREVLTGPRDPERLPSQLIWPSSGILTFILDKAAAALLPATDEEGCGVLERER